MNLISNYDHKKIELIIQNKWIEKQEFKINLDNSKKKYYCLSMFPYPSGKLHIGHIRNYTIGDIIARYKSIKNYNVLYPIGWDSFGIPAENAARINKTTPAIWTYSNIKYMKNQLKRLGFSFDWDREIITSLPEYYKWEQDFFIDLYNNGLVYRKKSKVNWDPIDKTVLSNEQVIDGKGWRSNAEIEIKNLEQWFVKISLYADKLLNGLKKLKKWPKKVTSMQKNWIGKSTGSEVIFKLKNSDYCLKVYTTRIETIFGVTFLAISDNNDILKFITDKSINESISNLIKKTRLLNKEKMGINTGLYAINPINGKEIPIWVANYVDCDGNNFCVMGVPAHDNNDFEFASKYGIDIKKVIFNNNEKKIIHKGFMISSEKYNGMYYKSASKLIFKDLNKFKIARKTNKFKIRDWCVSRQRYWGAPIPMIYCPNCGILPEVKSNLPVILPENIVNYNEKFSLKDISSFYFVNCNECKTLSHREIDTFDTFFESSWYFVKYICPNKEFNTKNLNDWLPVDQYIGGIEHAVLHLLYARFFFKLMKDFNIVNYDEPFINLLTQGMVIKDGYKMSKSRGNIVDHEFLIDKYGADTIRLFIIFCAPPEQSFIWNKDGIIGCNKFIKRLWNLSYKFKDINAKDITKSYLLKYANIIKQYNIFLNKANICMEKNYSFNILIASCMEFLNYVYKLNIKKNDVLIKFFLTNLIKIVYPIIPHVSNYIWNYIFNEEKQLYEEGWPDFIEEYEVKNEYVNIILQINGKFKKMIIVPIDSEKEALLNIIELKGTIINIIYIKNKLINILVK